MPRSVIEWKDINLAKAESIDARSRRVTLDDEKTPNDTTFILQDTGPNDCPAPVSVLVSELYRLWAATPQPRTQLVKTAVSASRYLVTEEIKTAEPYLRGTFTINPTVRKAIEADRTSGLAALLVIALTVGQGYLCKLVLNNKNQFVQREFDQALGIFWQDHYGFGCDFDFYSVDLQLLPHLRHYAPFQWLDVEFVDDILETPVYASNDTLKKLISNSKFLTEKYQTLLMIILTPFFIISEMADNLITGSSISDVKLKRHVLDILKKRLANLEKAAFVIPGFRKYLFEQTPDCLTVFLMKLKNFPDINPETIKMLMLLKYNSIKSQEHFESYLSYHPELPTRYKRSLLMDMIEDSLDQAKTFDEVMFLVAKIRDSAPYLILKQRQGFFRVSLAGTRHESVEVSASYDILILIAKMKLINIAKETAYQGDNSLLHTLSRRDNPAGKLIHMQRYRFFVDETHSAAEVRQLLATDFETQREAVEMHALSSFDNDSTHQLASRKARL
jgi:hypothetical protein